MILTTLDWKLARLVDECGEVLQTLGNISRFGLIATDGITEIKYDNIHDLLTGLNDLRHAMDQVTEFLYRQRAFSERTVDPGKAMEHIK